MSSPRRDDQDCERKILGSRDTASEDPFGDVLPDQTRDESARGWSERDVDRDEQLRREVPPHHY